MNDIERQSFWNVELEQEIGVVCVHCGSRNTEKHSELEYNDGAGEPNTSNYLVTVYHWLCKDCGDITHSHDYEK